MVPSMLGHKYVIRFCVNSENASEKDMHAAWDLIKSYADSVLEKYELEYKEIANDECPEMALRLKRIRFSLSKMVSDPKICNEKKYIRASTLFTNTGKYLAKKCSFVDATDEELEN